MKAAILSGLNTLEVKETTLPKLKPGAVLVKVLACAVCGSDIRILETGNPRVQYPAIIGHEIAGEIVEAEKNAKGLVVGNKVSIGADIPCGSCSWCQNGMGNCCDKNFAMGYQFSGGYAEYCLAHGLPEECIRAQYGQISFPPA